MNLRSTLQLILCGCIALPLTMRSRAPASSPPQIKPAPPAQAAIDEILSYDCARSISKLMSQEDQVGPVFFQGHLVLTSLEAQDMSKMLIVNAGTGNFAVKLEGVGVNRIRFELPGEDGGPRVFFLTYMHGNRMRSRVFDYGEDKPPVGHDELDYSLVPAMRAENVLPHLDYAIHETATAMLNALSKGRLAAADVRRPRMENCEHIARLWPNLGKDLKAKLEQIDSLIVEGPTRVAGRMPASTSR